jgi:hypothetical protein
MFSTCLEWSNGPPESMFKSYPEVKIDPCTSGHLFSFNVSGTIFPVILFQILVSNRLNLSECLIEARTMVVCKNVPFDKYSKYSG